MDASTMLLIYLIIVYSGMVIDIVSSVCPPGSYYQWNQQQCPSCKPGTYKSYEGNYECQYCNSGTYSSSPGSVSCTACEAGKYQPDSGQTSCHSCEIGQYQPNVGQGSCYSCGYGETTTDVGSTSISECVCSAGRYPKWTWCQLCEPGTYKTYAGNYDCHDCYPGTYSPSGARLCSACEAGKYQSYERQSSCQACEIGKYQPFEGKSSCYSCEDGRTTTEIGSTSDSQCVMDCDPGQFSSTRGYACQECSIGSYQPRRGQSSCLSCEPGTFQNQTGQILCSPCPEGTYQPLRDASSCIACAAGTYQYQSGSTHCLTCSVGRFQNAPGQTDCIICPTGSYSDVTQATNCMPCKTGSYQSSPGRSSCTPCPIGQYQPSEGQLSCYPCAAGETTAGTGSTSQHDCITKCSAGSFRSNQSLACENCSIGSYQPLTGQTSCLSCVAGTYQNQTGQTSCMNCLPGSYQSSSGSESCIKCSPGFFQPHDGSYSQCLACPVGSYQGLSGAVSCKKCLAGTFQNQTGQMSCIPCPKGSYQLSDGTNECIACPPGMYQNFAAQSHCLECPPGSYKSEPGSDLCTQCDVGMYQNLSGQISCYTCPNGTNTTGIGKKSIQECHYSENAVGTGADFKEHDTNLGVIAGGAGGSIALLVVVAIVIFIAIRRHRLKETRSHKTSRQDNVLPPPNDRQLKTSIQQQIRKVVYTNLVHKEDSKEDCKIDASNEYTSIDNTYYNMEENALLPRGAVMLSNLWDYVQEKTLDGSKLSEEFEALPSGLLSPAKAALKPSNCQKNRYKGLYPYDSTRVRLLPLREDKSDYINASFIDGYSRPKAYIASQGTTKFNLNDFWRMVYQQDVEKIVMLTRLAEGDTIKCLQYWPKEGSQQQYGGIKVTLVHVDAFAEYDIRTLTMTVENTTKQVTQFHFTAWPDKGVPEAASSIVQFWHKVRNMQPHKRSPTLVHCSAGIGRTGTYIALDYLVDQGKDKQYVHIFPCVAELRRQRVNLVQTEAQYRFLHEALVEALMISGSAVSAETFPSVYRELLAIDRKQRKTGLLLEFEKLQNESNKAVYHSPGDYDTDDEEDESESKEEKITNNPQRTSRLEINKHKNRYSNIILPADEYRPCLSLVEGRNDYINAVKLQSHRQKDGLIVTQMPIEDTVIDFWRLVYDFGVRTIVMLNVLPINEEGIGVYWPCKGASMTEMVFNIENVDENTDKTDYLWRTIRMTKDGEQPREVRQFQCNFWPGSEKVPKEMNAMLELIDAVEQWQRQVDIKTVVIHCMDGAERSGLYCVLTTVLERLNVERDVAIYQTVKKMRTRRQQIIPNFEQYKYCHDVVLEYLSNFRTYSNFTEI